MKNKKIINSIFIIISTALVIYIFSKVNWSEIDFNKISPKFFLLGIAFNICAYFVHAKRWSFFFIQNKVSYYKLFKIILAGSFLNTVLPSKAGEVIRPAYVKNIYKISYLKVLSTCFVERTLDTIFVLVVFSFSLMFSGLQKDLNIISQVVSLSLIVFSSMFFFYIIVQKKEFTERLLSKLPLKVSLRINNIVQEVKSGIDIPPKSFLNICLFTLLYWSVSILGFYFLLKAVVLPSEFYSPLVLVTLVGAIGLSLSLPSAPANIGIYNYTIYLVLIIFAGKFQLSIDTNLEQLIALVGIIMHLGAIIPDLILGFIGFASLPNIPLEVSSHHN